MSRLHLATYPALDDGDEDERAAQGKAWTTAMRAAARDRILRSRAWEARACAPSYCHEALTAATLAAWTLEPARASHVHDLAPMLLDLQGFDACGLVAAIEDTPAWAIVIERRPIVLAGIAWKPWAILVAAGVDTYRAEFALGAGELVRRMRAVRALGDGSAARNPASFLLRIGQRVPRVGPFIEPPTRS